MRRPETAGGGWADSAPSSQRLSARSRPGGSRPPPTLNADSISRSSPSPASPETVTADSRAPAAAAGRTPRAARPAWPAVVDQVPFVEPMTIARPSRSTRSTIDRSCFSNGIVASSSTPRLRRISPRGSHRSPPAFPAFPRCAALRRMPAVSNSFTLPFRHSQSTDRIAGDARFRPGQQPVFADHRVDQRRLAGVGTPDDGDAQRFVGVSVLIISGEARHRRRHRSVSSRRYRMAQRLMQLANALAMLGGERQRIAQAQRKAS
jgi:hypothetical protein